jgi:hypothetical protein
VGAALSCSSTCCSSNEKRPLSQASSSHTHSTSQLATNDVAILHHEHPTVVGPLDHENTRAALELEYREERRETEASKITRKRWSTLWPRSNAPQDRRDAKLELVEIDWLGDVVVDADAKPTHAIDGALDTGHEDDRNGRSLRRAAQVFDDEDLVHRGNVRDDEIWQLLRHASARFAVYGRLHGSVGSVERSRDDCSTPSIVVHEQDVRHGRTTPLGCTNHAANVHCDPFGYSMAATWLLTTMGWKTPWQLSSPPACQQDHR